ncbi:hypothetical protein [Mariniphaga sp.]|uniref:hypothetical protein n=1 Tax=Mariniphaga sp. TaxID=1954475 RepID=UPI00356345D4
MRVPVAYCLELPKEEDGEETLTNGVFIPENIELKPDYRSDFLGGVTVLKGQTLNREEKEKVVVNNPQLPEKHTSSDWKEGELYLPYKQMK